MRIRAKISNKKMIARDYYYQTPIMRRILEFIDGAAYVIGHQPDPDVDKPINTFDDIIHAMGSGFDLHRSILDFKKPLVLLDVEYANSEFPGEAFHNPLNVFMKLEGVRKKLERILDDNGVKYIELMTGQGYHFVMGLDRSSSSYKSLVRLGKHLRVLPWSASAKLLDKERQFDQTRGFEHIPLVMDNYMFAGFGRITDYLLWEANKDSQLPIKTTDVFSSEEIAIFDTTMYGYLINRRPTRSAFSLHQKSRMFPKFNYQGPPTVTIPVTDATIEERLKIRQDERENYKKAVNLANETSVEIPSSDLNQLIINYMMSPVYRDHEALSNELGEDKAKTDHHRWVLDEVNRRIPGIQERDIFWGIPNKNEILAKVYHSDVSQRVKEILDRPNPELLKPGQLNHLIWELRQKGYNAAQIVGTIAGKYQEDHRWSTDLTKNDPQLRAEYWLRTLQ